MISERTFAKSFASFWQELVPLLTPRFVSLFNEAYGKPIVNQSGNPVSAVAVEPGTRADVVAEFAFWAAKLLQDSGLSPDEQLSDEISREASKRALQVVERYEGLKPDELRPLQPGELTQGHALTKNYGALYRAFPQGSAIEFRPQFQGCGFLNAAEGDLGIGSTLVEVKTTTRKISGKDLRQLITYLALDAGAGRQRWSHVAIFNPRRGTFHRADVDALLLRVSGGKPRVDVLGDLVEFVQATELVNDLTF